MKFQVHHILRLFRRFLRIFDAESAWIYEVLPFILKLERDLEKFPVTAFLTAERKAEV